VRREVARRRLRSPRSVHYSYGQWQIVDDVGGQVYIYSAYYDVRPDIDGAQVRIIAVAKYDVKEYGLCCLLWYPSQRLPDVTQISVVQAGQASSPDGRISAISGSHRRLQRACYPAGYVVGHQ